MPPWRSRSMSSIESAPHTMPATNARILNAALAPPFAAIFTRSRSRAGRPQRSASAITGTSPAHDTRFGSSNRTLIAARAWDSRIQRMPFCARLDVAVVRTSSQLRGAFVCYDAPSPTHFGGGSRLSQDSSEDVCHLGLRPLLDREGAVCPHILHRLLDRDQPDVRQSNLDDQFPWIRAIGHFGKKFYTIREWEPFDRQSSKFFDRGGVA